MHGIAMYVKREKAEILFFIFVEPGSGAETSQDHLKALSVNFPLFESATLNGHFFPESFAGAFVGSGMDEWPSPKKTMPRPARTEPGSNLL